MKQQQSSLSSSRLLELRATGPSLPSIQADTLAFVPRQARSQNQPDQATISRGTATASQVREVANALSVAPSMRSTMAMNNSGASRFEPVAANSLGALAIRWQ